MSQVRTITPLNGTFTVTGTPYGDGNLNTGNASGLLIQSNGAIQLGIRVNDDLAIPRGATITNVTTKFTLSRSATTVNLVFNETDGVSTQTNTPSGTLAKFPSFSIMTNNWGTSSPDGTTFTPVNIFTTRFYITASGGTVDDFLKWSAFSLVVTFTLPTPTVTTNAARQVVRTHATLAGTINPNTATSTYYVRWYFQYGKSVSYGTTTTVTGTLTGSEDVILTYTTPNNLTPNTVYHFRLVGKLFDNTLVLGSDNTFTTPLVDTAVFRF